MTPPTAKRVRRGTAAIGVIIALVLLQLTVVGMVMAGAREHDLTTKRLDTLRAFYAAEGGVNMAVRELTVATDADGDGVVGSISADGVDSDDPVIGSARVGVTLTVSDGITTVTARGRAGDAVRVLRLTAQ